MGRNTGSKQPPSASEASSQQFQDAIYLQNSGKFREAEDIFLALSNRFPKETSLHNRLGQVSFALGDLHSAARHFSNSLDIKPDSAEILANLGVIYRRLKRYDEALDCQRRAIETDPRHAHAYNNLGILLHEVYKKSDEALVTFDNAIAINKEFSDAHYNKGNVFKDLGMRNEAIACYQKAISFNPKSGSALMNMGIVFSAQKNFPEAIKYYKMALDVGAKTNFIDGQLIYTLLHVCDWSEHQTLVKALIQDIEEAKPATTPFSLLAIIDDPAIQLKATQTFVGIDHPPRQELPAPKTHASHQRIRIGYFSSDYWNHPVSHLMLGLFNAHNRNRFEVIAFSYGNPPTDPWHERVKRSCDQFIDVSDASDLQIAELARQMEIDVAVDLNGFTENRRTNVFAYRAAPVQVSYIGYLGTMGAPYMDYLIADQTIIPPQSRMFYTEKIIYLPSFQCNDPQQQPIDKPMTRSEFGLPEDAFVYCSFNNNYKITPNVFACWMQILNCVPKSVLWLYVNNDIARQNLEAEALKSNITKERLIFANKVPLETHLARQRLADVFLDTWPYNAGATASNALRVGLPVLTKLGKSFASRMGGSLLKAVGLKQMIAHSDAEYITKAVLLAENAEFLADVRAQLASNLSECDLFNNEAFARHIETAYLAAHQRACAGQEPIHILVKQ